MPLEDLKPQVASAIEAVRQRYKKRANATRKQAVATINAAAESALQQVSDAVTAAAASAAAGVADVDAELKRIQKVGAINSALLMLRRANPHPHPLSFVQQLSAPAPGRHRTKLASSMRSQHTALKSALTGVLGAQAVVGRKRRAAAAADATGILHAQAETSRALSRQLDSTLSTLRAELLK